MIRAKLPHEVHQKVVNRSVSGMLEFIDVFEFFVHTFYDGPFAEHDLACLRDVKVFPILEWLDDHLDAVSPKEFS